MILTNHDHQIRVGVLTGNGRRRGPRRGSGGCRGSGRAVRLPGAPPPAASCGAATARGAEASGRARSRERGAGSGERGRLRVRESERRWRRSCGRAGAASPGSARGTPPGGKAARGWAPVAGPGALLLRRRRRGREGEDVGEGGLRPAKGTGGRAGAGPGGDGGGAGPAACPGGPGSAARPAPPHGSSRRRGAAAGGGGGPAGRRCRLRGWSPRDPGAAKSGFEAVRVSQAAGLPGLRGVAVIAARRAERHGGGSAAGPGAAPGRASVRAAVAGNGGERCERAFRASRSELGWRAWADSGGASTRSSL